MLTVDQIQSLAPDAASLSAARGLASTSKWETLGVSDTALWGECRGSGAKPYQVQIDPQGPTVKCSCPSRKIPCKHGLALLLIRAQQSAAVPTAEPPAWVMEWLAARSQRATQKEEKTAKKARGEADPKAEAQARKKEEKRWTLMQTGLDELDTWLGDQVRRGYGAMAADGVDCRRLASRLVDAQLPGLARRIQTVADLMARPDARTPERVLRALGLLRLLVDGCRRYPELPFSVQGDLRAAMGWTFDKEDILALAPPVEDTWRVLGLRLEADGKLWERRVWLHGEASGRRALIVDYAHGGPVFSTPFVVGHAIRAALGFYPSQDPDGRALLTDGMALVAETVGLPDGGDFKAEVDRLSRAVSAQPWTNPRGLLIPRATLVRAGTRWVLQTPEGAVFPPLLADGHNQVAGWDVLARGGRATLGWFGEWDGERFRALSAWTDRVVWTGGIVA